MKQAVAGVRPAEVEEAPVMTIYPSVAATGIGRLLGKLFAIRAPNLYIFRLGNLFALMAIPLALALYFGRLVPSLYRMTPCAGCYRLTNRRVLALRNEILHEQARYKFGALLGFVAAIVGVIVCYVIVSIFFPELSLFWQIAIFIGIAVVGALKWYAIGCWRFVFFTEAKSVRLDAFDSIEVDVRPGQDWHHAGDLVFRSGATETFRLEGVSRPEAFRQACLNAHHIYNGVRAATSA
jgi:hypothetical protein